MRLRRWEVLCEDHPTVVRRFWTRRMAELDAEFLRSQSFFTFGYRQPWVARKVQADHR